MAPSWSDGLAREQQTGLLPLTTPSMCDDEQLSDKIHSIRPSLLGCLGHMGMKSAPQSSSWEGRQSVRSLANPEQLDKIIEVTG